MVRDRARRSAPTAIAAACVAAALAGVVLALSLRGASAPPTVTTNASAAVRFAYAPLPGERLAATSPSAAQTPRDTGCVIVRYRDRNGTVRTDTKPVPRGMTTAAYARKLSAASGVIAEPDYLLTPALGYTSQPNDPDYQDSRPLPAIGGIYEIVSIPYWRSWALHGGNSARFDQVWPALTAAKASAEQVHVAVIDTGFYSDHPDAIGSNIRSAIDECETYDPATGALTTDSDTTPVPLLAGDTSDEIVVKAHGTMVASEIGAKANNGVGVLGATYDTVVDIYKVQGRVKRAGALTNDTYLPESALINAIDDATADAKAHGYRLVINVSLVLDGVDASTLTLMRASIADSRAAGVVVVAASGNEGVSTVSYPAAISGVIGVGASTVTASGPVWAQYSNYGSALDIMAPGTSIWGPTREPVPNSSDVLDYRGWTGTSMATPLVSSAAALLLRVEPTLAPGEVASYLTSGTVDMNTTGWDSRTGWGRLDAYQSYLLLAAPRTTANVKPLYGGHARIDFAVTDRDSGTNVVTHYRIDGGPELTGPYAESSSVGTHTLEYWSVDGNGVRELTTYTATFDITIPDTVPPVTSSDATATYAGLSTIRMTAIDPPADTVSSSWGVAATHYLMDAGTITTGTVATTGKPGFHMLQYWSVDLAGNVEPPTVTTFTVSIVRPTLSIYRSASAIRHGSKIKLWGYLTPARVGDSIRIQVKLPGYHTWRYFTGYSKYYKRTITLVSSRKGSWSPLSYALTRHGRYYFRAYFTGDSTYISRTSRYSNTVSVYVR